MSFLIVVIWGIISLLVRAFEVISTADMYIGMTIFLAANYITCEIENKM